MRPNRALLAVLAHAALFALGCSEDVGSCDDPRKGQDTVLVNGRIQYGGQAIMNASCANGCHQSSAKGDARLGAPAGLDFDLRPIAEADADGIVMTTTDHTVVNLKKEQVAGLRERQRNVFEKRNLIWQQIKDGLMPPDGIGERFKRLVGIVDTNEASPCVGVANGYMDITTKPSQDILRNWLACNTPIVESEGAQVDQNGVAGQAGYQYISCEDSVIPPVGDGGVESDAGGELPAEVVTLEDIQDAFVETQCGSCHPAVNDTVDLTSVDKSFASLVMDTEAKCDGKPYVTPGDPSKSYLYDLVSKEDPGCGTQRMPLGEPLSRAQIKQISDWITGGAKREADVKSIQQSLSGGLDAGAP